MCINLLCVLCWTCLLLTGHIRVNSQYQTGAVLQGQNFMIKIPVFCSYYNMLTDFNISLIQKRNLAGLLPIDLNCIPK